MRFLKILAIFAAAVTVAGIIALPLTGHQMGSRPSSSIAEYPVHPDVQFIEAHGVRFGYIEMGEGPLVLLFHGYPETARSWREVQPLIAAQGYRTIAVFMRGYPPSDMPGDYSVRALGRDVVGLIDAFGEETAFVVGHDWGAIAVYEAAHVAPDRIRGLIALSIPHPRGTEGDLSIFRDAPHFLYYQSPFAERLIWSHDFAHLRRIYRSWSPGYSLPQVEFADVVESFRTPGAIEASLGYYRAIFVNGEDNAELSGSDPITVPSLVIVGDNDGAITIDRFETAASAFTNEYTLELLSGVGHFPQVEQPRAVADSITGFLALH